jgi:hypothetical protein
MAVHLQPMLLGENRNMKPSRSNLPSVLYIILKPKYLQSLKTGRRLGWKALLELFCITKELQQWLEVGKTDPQVRLLYGAPSIGKTFLCRASAHWNFPKMLYLTSLSSWDWRVLLRQLCIFLCPDDDLTALTGEALLDLFMTRVDPGTQILLDQSEHLADEIIPHLFVLSRQKDLSIILITNTMPAYQADTFYLQPIAQSLEFHQLAQFYAPVTIQHRLFVDTIRPILDDAARYHLRHQKATAQN